MKEAEMKVNSIQSSLPVFLNHNRCLGLGTYWPFMPLKTIGLTT